MGRADPQAPARLPGRSLCRHGAREAFEVHSGGFFHLVSHPRMLFSDPARSGVGKFVAGPTIPRKAFSSPATGSGGSGTCPPAFQKVTSASIRSLAGHGTDAGQARHAAHKGKTRTASDGRLARARGIGPVMTKMPSGRKAGCVNQWSFPGKVRFLKRIWRMHGVSVRREVFFEK